MPLPVAHSLVGASLAAAVLPRAGSRRYYAGLAAAAFLANAADLDFLLSFALGSRGWHRGFTHSLAFALVVFLALLAGLGPSRARKAAAYGLAYASHAALDFATTLRGGGLELFWPLSGERVGLRWWGLSEIPSRLPPAEVVRYLCLEFALFAPMLLAVLLLRRGCERRGRPGAV